MDTIRFAKQVEAVSGHSDADTQEGLNLILGIADEIDAFRSRAELQRVTGARARESSASAEAILEMIQTSASTRFPKVYKNVRISYPRYKGSKIQQLIAEGEADIEAKGEASRHYVSGPLSTWDVNPRISGKEDFADDYERDPIMAAAKYECNPSFAVNPYFSNEIALRACVRPGYVPVTVDYIRDRQAWKPVYWFHEDFYPVQGALYAMHADLAISGDRAGLALAHVKSWDEVEVQGETEEGLGTSLFEQRPVVKVDFVFGYEASREAQPPREIQIRWAGDLCLELRRRGFPIVLFTADQYQSADLLQRLEVAGVETDRFSLDRDESGWKTLRDVAYEGRLELPDIELALTELLQLSRLPNGKVDHPGDGCFVGDTRVPLLAGREVQIRELADGEPVWVYASDDQGRVVPALAVGRRTKQVRQLCDVILDSGAVVRCTPEHLWRLRDGSYKEAQALTRADRLMPLRRKYDLNSGYELVHGRDVGWEWTHKLVREALDGKPLSKDEVSHHDNEVKTDNRPENLIRMDRIEHLAHHARKRHAEDPSFVTSLRRAQREYWESSAARAQQAEVARKSQTGRAKPELRQRHLDRLELLRSALDARSVGAAARQVGLHRNSAIAVLNRFGFKDWADFRDRDGANHKVRFVELVELDEPVWVYDLEVDAFHNFALTAGVFVQNSKDLADGLGGAVTGAIRAGGREDEDGSRAYLGAGHQFGGVTAGLDLTPIGMPPLELLGDAEVMPQFVRDRAEDPDGEDDPGWEPMLFLKVRQGRQQ
jgi:hypothetical protein